MPHTNTPARKPIFDVVRRILGRGFRQSEVDAIDSAFELGDVDNLDTDRGTGLETRVDGHPDSGSSFSHLDSVSSVSNIPIIKRKTHVIGDAGIALIKRFEGCARLRRDGLVGAYPDPGTGGDPWTIGWGATGLDDQTGHEHGNRIGPSTVWTQAQCDARLASDLRHYASDVAQAIDGAPTTQAQFDALVSFHYNPGAIHRATLTKKHKAGDYEGAVAEFARWKHGGGRVLKGLVRRRAEEAKLYASG